MIKKTIMHVVIFFVLIHSISAIPMEEITKCVLTNCSFLVNNCLNNTDCNATVTCFKDCDARLESCRDICTDNVKDNQPFWSLDLCSSACMAVLEIEDGHQETLNRCMHSQCLVPLNACHRDQQCKKALGCVMTCYSSDFDCTGKCISENGSNSILINLIECNSECLWDLVDQSMYYIRKNYLRKNLLEYW